MDRNHEGERVMTRAEAIEILKNLVGYESGCAIGAEGFRLELYRYRVEALEMAIEALKAEPKLRQALEQEKGAYNALVANVHCNDCISRAEAINAISHAEVNFTVTSMIDFADYKREIQEIVDHIVEAQVKALNDLPSVSPQQKVGKWILVRLYANGIPVSDWWECSECRWEYEGDENTLPTCCPGCETKMEVMP